MSAERNEAMSAIDDQLTVIHAVPPPLDVPDFEDVNLDPDAEQQTTVDPVTGEIEPTEPVAKDETKPETIQDKAKEQVKKAKKQVRLAQGRIAKLPTPGAILTPLIVLLILFMILVPFNGKTRIVWLWYAFTGNASIKQQAGGSTDITFSTEVQNVPGYPGNGQSPFLTVTGNTNATFPNIPNNPYQQPPIGSPNGPVLQPPTQPPTQPPGPIPYISTNNYASLLLNSGGWV